MLPLTHCSRVFQLEELEDAAGQARRQEAAARAVLAAAQRAAREGRGLNAEEISAIRQPILNPPTAEELAAQREAEQQVLRSATHSWP